MQRAAGALCLVSGILRNLAMIQARVAALAAGLRSSLLLQPGDVVALAMRPSDTFLESLLAITACGCIAALLNLRWSVAEAAEAVQNSKARLILADEVGRQLLQPCATSVQLIHTDLPAGDAHLYSCEKMIRQHRGTPYRLSLPQNGAAVICFTSGSTGRSKGAVLSHIAFHCQALAKVVEVGYDRSDTYLHCAPLYHVGGLSSALAYLMLGAKQVFQPQYSAATACALIEDHQARTPAVHPDRRLVRYLVSLTSAMGQHAAAASLCLCVVELWQGQARVPTMQWKLDSPFTRRLVFFFNVQCLHAGVGLHRCACHHQRHHSPFAQHQHHFTTASDELCQAYPARGGIDVSVAAEACQNSLPERSPHSCLWHDRGLLVHDVPASVS